MPARFTAACMQRNAPRAIFRRRRDVIGVARHAVPDHFAIDLRTARLGVFHLFQNHHPGAFAHDETVAAPVPGTAGRFRCILEAGRQRLGGSKSRNAQASHRRLCATGHHDIGIIQRDEPGGITDSMRTGRAGGHDRMVRALEAILNGNVS